METAKEQFLDYIRELLEEPEPYVTIFLPVPKRNLANELFWLSEYDDELGQTPLEVLGQVEDEHEWLDIWPRRISSATTEEEMVASAMLSLALTMTQARVSLQLPEDFDDGCFISMQQWNIVNADFVAAPLDWMMLEKLSLCTAQCNELSVSLFGPLNSSRGDEMYLDGLPNKLELKFGDGVDLKDAETIIRHLAKSNGRQLSLELCSFDWPRAINLNPLASSLRSVGTNVPIILTKPSFANVYIYPHRKYWRTVPWHEHDVITNGKTNLTFSYLPQRLHHQVAAKFLLNATSVLDSDRSLSKYLTQQRYPDVVVYTSFKTLDPDQAASLFPRLLLLSHGPYDEQMDVCVGKSRVMPDLSDFCPLLQTVIAKEDQRLRMFCTRCAAASKHPTAMDKLVSVAVAFEALEECLPLPVWLNLIRATFYVDVFGNECLQ
jgi:hypothetical protein